MAKDSNLVLAYFDSEAQADKAVQAIKEWDEVMGVVDIGSIGILYKDDKGKVKTRLEGAKAGGKGAKTGMILGVIAAILSGGITLLGGVIGGAIGGGVLGSFFHKGLKLSPDDLNSLNSELDAGHVAVGLMVDDYEIENVTVKLGTLGGRTESFAVSGEAIDNAEQLATEAGIPTAAGDSPEATPSA